MKKEAKKAKVGRPPIYQTPEELQAKINEYFEKGVNQKVVLIGPANNRSECLIKVPTITGLVLYCGFCDRTSFYDMEKKPEFAYTIKTARTRIAQEYEEQLQTSMPTGAIFALKNFDWKDSQEVVVKEARPILVAIPIERQSEYANRLAGIPQG